MKSLNSTAFPSQQPSGASFCHQFSFCHRFACGMGHLRLYSWANGNGAKTMSSSHIGAQTKAATSSAAVTDRFLVPVARVEGLRQRGFSNDEIYRIVGPRRTLARRKERGEALTVAESDRVVRLERISAMADRVFGSHEKAQRWLRKHSKVLGETPINLLQSETGAVLVEEELHRIDYGIFA
ncbi:antitoxin Xre/MbcA/ParS toxin-binding domain-containing protein [Mesorhizobium sp. WSM4906]|uniref:antitoxin Xre/MbcA/ParS toxin-binding domain-containing protein n=1 Tax=Mesorhizobium sp. WSM4906 TaxID=3038546 RepID=UPI002416C530|nr:antitoxin Xre/MbcA/ParS toxin-binding domain-containing protein [Mesorhizobium sp. WSM4906]WFP74665.1 DUF2384 domain-containing protein [Mesorhizobium sp. WSM4906]